MNFIKMRRTLKGIVASTMVAAVVLAGSLNVRGAEISYDNEDSLVISDISDISEQAEQEVVVEEDDLATISMDEILVEEVLDIEPDNYDEVIEDEVSLSEDSISTVSENSIVSEDESLLGSAGRASAYIDSVSLSLGREIGINFYIDPTGLANDTIVRVNDSEYRLNEIETDIDNLKCVSYNVPPRCIGDVITVSVSGYSYEYSIRQFINDVVDNKTAGNKFKTLCESIDNYGKCAQIYFDYKADEITEEIVIDEVSGTGGFEKIVNGEMPNGIEYYGTSLLLNDTVSFRHYFKLTGNKNINDFKFKTSKGLVTPAASGSLYYVQSEDIPATELGEYVQFSVNDSWNIFYSPLSYLCSASPDRCSTKLINLCRSMYWYYKSTLDYFNLEYKGCHHTFDTTVLVKPTTTTVGETRYSCSACGYSYISIVDKKATTCDHNGYNSTAHVVKEANETEDGLVEYVCNNCGEIKSTTVNHSYQEYTIDIGDGKTATIYGYFDRSISNEVFTRLNEYRVANGLSALNYAKELQDEADIRAIESSYSFSHTRPDSSSFNSDNKKYMNAENIAYSFATAEKMMNAWKSSKGHNAIMLATAYKSAATSVFIRVSYDEGEVVQRSCTYGVQEFSLYADPLY